MSRRVNKFETLKVLHRTWRKKEISSSQLKQMLMATEFLHLTSLTNDGIKAESPDGKSKYSIKNLAPKK
jgi:hypothetical protein